VGASDFWASKFEEERFGRGRRGGGWVGRGSELGIVRGDDVDGEGDGRAAYEGKGLWKEGKEGVRELGREGGGRMLSSSVDSLFLSTGPRQLPPSRTASLPRPSSPGTTLRSLPS